MAILKISCPDKTLKSENFEVVFDVSDDGSKLEIEIIDKYPKVAANVAIQRQFFFIDNFFTSGSVQQSKVLSSEFIGFNFIDRNNESGKRMIIYRYDIPVGEFSEKENVLLISIDSEGNEVICDPFQLKRVEDVPALPEVATKQDIEKLQSEIDGIDTRLSDLEGQVNGLVSGIQLLNEIVPVVKDEAAALQDSVQHISETHDENFQKHLKNFFRSVNNIIENLKKKQLPEQEIKTTPVATTENTNASANSYR